MAESFSGLYEWELISKQGPWRGLDERRVRHDDLRRLVQPPRLHGEITNDATDTTPIEAEVDYYRQNQPVKEAIIQ